jgi:hypothetical protein
VASQGEILPLASTRRRGSKNIYEVGPPQLASGIQPILAAGKKGSAYLRVPPYLGVAVVGAGVVVVAGVVGFAVVVVAAGVVAGVEQLPRSRLNTARIMGTTNKYFLILSSYDYLLCSFQQYFSFNEISPPVNMIR